MPWELKLQAVVRCLAGLLGTLKGWAISQHPSFKCEHLPGVKHSAKNTFEYNLILTMC